MPAPPSARPPSSAARNDPRSRQAARQSRLELGIEHCRFEEWELGLRYLEQTLADGEPQGTSAGLACSYYGFALAILQERTDEGLELCRRGVELEFYQPETHLNLARLLMLKGDTRRAIAAVENGLAIDPDHGALVRLRLQLGHRQRPVLPFLGRGNLLNRLLGSLRHRLREH